MYSMPFGATIQFGPGFDYPMLHLLFANSKRFCHEHRVQTRFCHQGA
jgi:hypothetical protein